MGQYIIQGGVPLVGEVAISGAKNSALGILAAAVMCDETVTIRNVPDVSDIAVFLDAIRSIGAEVSYPDPGDRHVVNICGRNIHTHTVDNEYIRKIRASYYLIGALLGKYKEANVARPGGCDIGLRPIDQHQKGFKAMGARMVYDDSMIFTNADRLVGTNIRMDTVSVGATINIMLAASMAEGVTTIEPAAKEPHVVDVAQFLNQMGANIKGAGTDTIRIRGVKKFRAADHEIIPDQIEAGTFMCAAAVTGGDVTVTHVIPRHLESVSAKLVEMGADVEVMDDAVRVRGPKRLRRTEIKTMPYPGFPTDMQAQFTACLGLADGVSFVTENIFEHRFKYTEELDNMGARINVEGHTAIISGVDKYTRARLTVPDLRAGAALVIAALAAEGVSTVDHIYYIERGYEDFDGKLRSLGGIIEKVDASSPEELERMRTKFSLKNAV